MKNGSDAVADWPLANCASGADWVSLYNDGGVGIGNFTHSGMVIVATGTPEKAKRLKRVLTTDPGLGIFRDVNAGYELAQDVAHEREAKILGLKWVAGVGVCSVGLVSAFLALWLLFLPSHYETTVAPSIRAAFLGRLPKQSQYPHGPGTASARPSAPRQPRAYRSQHGHRHRPAR